MTVVAYDGSFAGLFTAVFEIYEYKISEPNIIRDAVANGSLFGNFHTVITNETKAARVYNKLQSVISAKTFKQLYDVYLSELKDIDNLLFRYMQYALRSKFVIENDYSNADVLLIQQTSRKVHREKHRMEAFVRFKLTQDNLYYATIQPDYNVLPLICKHFKDRYADQRWLIYDVQRKYGLYYDMQTVEEVQLNFSETVGVDGIFDEQEELYQQLWQVYFSNVNIKARKNMKLHIQHMPRRYWKFLTEKQSFS
jgi:probable DNA metabolism protein